MFFEKEFTHFTYEAQGISLSFFLINAYSPTHSLHKQQTGPPQHVPFHRYQHTYTPGNCAPRFGPCLQSLISPALALPVLCSTISLEKRRFSGQCIMLSRDLRQHFMFPHRRAAQFHLFPLNDRVRCHLFQDTHS